MIKSLSQFLLTLAAACSCAIPALADPWTPTDLNPGDRYRLVFVTSVTRDGLSANISDYDQFVNAAAHAPGSVVASLPSMQWLAIASTSTTDAYTHIGGAFAAPLYRLDGVRVAANAGAFWNTLNAWWDSPIMVNQNGTSTVGLVWTGSFYDGSPYPGYQLGLGGEGAAGISYAVDGCAIVCQAAGSSGQYSIYAISASELVFGASPTTVPESSALPAMLLGTAALATRKRLRR